MYVKGKDNLVTDMLSWLPCKNLQLAAAVKSAPDSVDLMNNEVLVAACVTSILQVGLDTLFAMAFALTRMDMDNQKTNKLTWSFEVDKTLVKTIQERYYTDLWCANLVEAARRIPSLKLVDGL